MILRLVSVLTIYSPSHTCSARYCQLLQRGICHHKFFLKAGQQRLIHRTLNSMQTSEGILVLKHLLESTSNVINLKDEHRKTPLHYACSNDQLNESLAELLIEHIAMLSIGDSQGNTPFSYAIKNPKFNEQFRKFSCSLIKT
jgi:hypothetical protein